MTKEEIFAQIEGNKDIVCIEGGFWHLQDPFRELLGSLLDRYAYEVAVECVPDMDHELIDEYASLKQGWKACRFQFLANIKAKTNTK